MLTHLRRLFHKICKLKRRNYINQKSIDDVIKRVNEHMYSRPDRYDTMNKLAEDYKIEENFNKFFSYFEGVEFDLETIRNMTTVNSLNTMLMSAYRLYQNFHWSLSNFSNILSISKRKNSPQFLFYRRKGFDDVFCIYFGIKEF